MNRVTRAFTGRRRAIPAFRPASTTPAPTWPVLTAEVTPDLRTRRRGPSRSRASSTGRRHWTWDEIHALPPSRYEGDIHCVTTWSKFGMTFAGVSVDTLLAAAGPLPAATHVLAFSHTGYTTNLPLADVTGGRAWVVWEVDGAPLPRRARRPGPAAGPAPVLLEERQVGGRAPAPRPRRARVLGAARLPRPRRPLARAALPGRLIRCRRACRRRPSARGRRAPSSRSVPRPGASRRSGSPSKCRSAISPASTSSSDSPRPTATSPSAPTRSASAPGAGAEVEITVERLPDGEVSGFLHDEVVVGDELEVRGPIGGWFVWPGDAPALLVGGGSGSCP